jgi:hypothetical protein
MYLNLALFLFCLSLFAACAGVPPHSEYVIALTALENAKKTNSDKLEPDLTFQSKKYFDIAVNFYKERNYSKAKQYFLKSRFIAEKAEVRARIKKYKNGEVVL